MSSRSRSTVITSTFWRVRVRTHRVAHTTTWRTGLMLGGFGLVAWPAHWGNTGVMTFIVNQDGEIYEKDLGPTTAAIAKGITRFDPDTTWQKCRRSGADSGGSGRRLSRYRKSSVTERPRYGPD